MAYQTLKMGSPDSADLRLAQSILINLQYLPASTAPGIFGPVMDGAVRAFQRASGLGVDGIIGANTWSKLVQASGGAPVVTPAGNNTTANTQGVNPAWSFEPVDVVGRVPGGPGAFSFKNIWAQWDGLKTWQKALLVGGGLAAGLVITSKK